MEQEIQSLDRELVKLQKSTRTTVPALLPLHDVLRQRFSWYYQWHLWPWSKFFHMLFLLVFVLGIGGIFYQFLFAQPGKVLAATTTLRPNGDVAAAWTPTGTDGTCTGTNCETVDEATLDQTDYVSNGGSPGVEDIYNWQTQSGVVSVSQIDVHIVTTGPPTGSIDLNIYMGSWKTAQGVSCAAQQSPPEEKTKTWLGSWTQAELDGLQTSIKQSNLGCIVLQMYVVATYTTATVPTVVTVTPTPIAATAITFQGNVTSDGGSTITERGFKFKAGAACGPAPTTRTVAGTTGTYSYEESPLSVNSQYSYMAYATNVVGSGTGSCLTQYTLANTPDTAPTVANPQLTTLDVTVNDTQPGNNPATTLYAVGIDQDSNGSIDASGYVRADYTLGAAPPLWQTKANWGTKTVTGLASCTAYNFRVMAKNGDNVMTALSAIGSESTTGCVTPPNPPTNPYINGVTTSAMVLNWTDASSDETDFHIERSTDGVSFTEQGTAVANATSYSGACSVTRCWFRVRAHNASGYSSYATTQAITKTTHLLPASEANKTFRLLANETKLAGEDGETATLTAAGANSTYYDADNNKLFTAENSTDGRFEKVAASTTLGNPVPGSAVRIEESRTNLILNSSFENRTGNDFDNWTEYAAGSSTVTAETSDLLHSSTAVKFTVDASNSDAEVRSPSISVSSSTSYTFSYYAKQTSSCTSRYRIYDVTRDLYLQSNGSWGVPIIYLYPGHSDNWARVTNSFTTGTTTAQLNIRVGRNGACASQSMYLDAVQIEAGAFVTSYIPTAAASATRNAENLDYPTADNMPTTAGTVSMWVKTDWDSNYNASAAGYHGLFDNGYSTGDGGLMIAFVKSVAGTDNPAIRAWIKNKTTTPAYNPSFTSNEWHHVAVTYQDGQQLRLYWDGQLAGTSAGTDSDIVNVLTSFRVGRWDNASKWINGLISDFTIFNTALTGDQVTGLYYQNGPTNVNMQTPTVTGMDITYNDNSSNESSFAFQRSQTSDCSSFTAPASVSDPDTSASANTQYCYRANATVGSHTSPYATSSSPKYSGIEPPGSITFSNITTVNITIVPTTTTFTNNGVGSSTVKLCRDGQASPPAKCTTGDTSNPVEAVDFSGLSINTQYSFTITSYNGDGVANTSPATGNKYTLANAPITPTCSVYATTSVKIVINKNSNPEGPAPADDTDYSFGLDNDGNGSVDASGYVQADGTLGAPAVWQTYSTWGGDGGKVNTGLTSGSSYYYIAQARNGNDTTTAFSSRCGPVTLPYLYTWDGGDVDDNNWSSTGNWIDDTVPIAGATVRFTDLSTKASTIDAGFAVTITALNIGSGYTNTITQNRGLTVSGDFTLAGGIFNTASQTINVGGSWNSTGGALSSTGTINFNSGTTGKTITADNEHFYNLTFNNAAGGWTFNDSQNVDNNFTISAANSLTLGAFTHTVSGTVTLGGTTLTTTDSTLVMDGTTKNLIGGGKTLNNLTISGTVTEATSDVTVGGTLIIDNAKSLTINSGRTLTQNGSTATITGTLTSNGTFAPAAGTTVGGTGTLTGTGTVKVSSQTPDAFATQYTINTKTLTNLTVDYTGTSAGGQTLTDTVYGNAGSGGLKISGTLNSLTQNATVGGVFTMNSGTFTPGAGTITMNASSSIANTAGTLAFFNLTIAGTGVSSARNFTINGKLQVNVSSAFTHTNTITMATVNWSITNLAAPTALSLAALTISETPTNQSSVSFSMNNTLTVNSGKNFSPTGGTITMTAGTIAPSGTATLTFNNLTVTGTVNASSTWSINGILSVGASGSLTGSTTTLNDGSSISVADGGNLQFGNLYVANGAAATGAGDFRVVASLTLNNASSSLVIASGTFSNAGNLGITTNGGTLTFNNLTAVTWYITTASSFSINGVLTINANVPYFNATAGTITMNDGASITNNAAANKLIFYNLAIANNATVTTASSFTISENLSVGTGTASFAASAGEITFSSGAIANSGTLTFNSIVLAGAVSSSSSFSVAGNWTNNSSFTHSAGTVTLNGAGAQSVAGSSNTTFNNLDITTAAARAITFTGNSTTTVSGTWNVTGSAGNVITMQSSDANNWTINPVAANVTYTTVSKSNSGLKLCATYSTDGGGNNSNWYFSTTNSCAPPQITNLSATPTGTDKIRWNFTNSGSNTTSIRLYNTSDAQTFECTGANLTSCEETGLSTNALYTRKIKAVNGWSPGDTFSDPPLGIYTLAAQPGDPTSIAAQSWSEGDGNSINVTLAANGNPNGTEFEIYYDTDPEGTFVTTAQTFTAHNNGDVVPHSSLFADTTYYYKVKARNGNEVVTDYNPAAGSALTAPAQPSWQAGLPVYAPTIDTNSITWDWNDNLVAPTGYRLYNSATNDEVCAAAAPSGCTQTESSPGNSLQPNVSYTVKSQAYRGAITGQPSAVVSAYTAIEDIVGVSWGAFTTTALSGTPSNTPSNLTAGTSGIQYKAHKVSDNSLIDTSSWQQNTNSFSPAPALDINTQYRFEIQSRNGDSRTTTAGTAQKYTRANVPITPSHSAIGTDSITWTWAKNSNPSWTEFYASDDSGANSGWVADSSSWDSTVPAKTPNTQFTATIKARNGDSIDTDTIQASAYTAIETPATITTGLITPNSIALNISDSLTNLTTGFSGIQYEETTHHDGYGGETGFLNAADPANRWKNQVTVNDVGLKGAVSGAVGTTYTYKIKARNAESVETAQSGEFSFTTTAGTQLLFQLPGETLDESGVNLLSYSDPTPSTAVAGVPFNITIYAADPADYRDLAHLDTIALTSTDPVAQFPTAAAMTNGTITYNNVIFQTVGNHTITGLGSAGSSHEFAVVAGGASPGDSTVTASPTSLYVDQTSTVTITIYDSFGNPLAGHAVSVSSDQAGDVITFSAAQTGANGRIYAYVTSSSAHTSIITARDTTDGVTLTDKPQITFNPLVVPTPTPTVTPTPTPTVTTTPGDQPPTVPTNLRATDIAATSIDLAWDSSTDDFGVAGYELYNADTGILIGTTATTNFSLAGLQPDTSYRFYVRAFDAARNFSPFSNILTITTRPPGTPEEKKIEEEGGVVAYLVMGNLPKEIDAGQSFPNNVRVSAADAGGRIVTGYNKAVYFSSSDKNASLTFDNKNMYTFTDADAGIHEFAGRDFVLNTAGKQKLTVSDYSTTSTAEIMVKAAGALPIIQNFLAKPENMSKVNTGVVTTTAAVLLIPLLINTALNFGTLLPQIIYWLTQLFQLLGIRKRRKSWGVVFNSQTGQPISLAMVRIIDKKYNRVLEQAVTDNQGRYGFLVREGTFYITVTKGGFVFPSKEKSSTFYEKIYVGGDFKVAGKEQTVAYNIPLDPHMKPSAIIGFWVFFIKFNRLLERLRLPLLVIGIIFSVIMMVVAFEMIYLLSLVFYILLGILEYLRTRKARPYGVVTDTFNHPLEMTIVRIYKKENNRLIETDVTDRDGRFRFLVAPGVYYVVASKPGYIDFKSHLMYLEKEKTLVSTTIKLKKEEK